MIKQIFLAIWICIATVGAAYGAIWWKLGQSAAGTETAEATKIKEIRTRPINVPIISDGAVQGFVVAQFVFMADSKLITDMSINPEVYLLDEAFKTIYAGEKVNFKQMKRQDLPKLAKAIGDGVNKRLGAEVVRDVLLDQLSYVPRVEIRGQNEAENFLPEKPKDAPKAKH